MPPPITSFPPIVGARPRVLVLGSMPSRSSLAQRQYYAHPRNAFWTIVESLTGCSASADYAQRTAALKRAGVAVWDALKSCERSSSLDADIRPGSMIANDVGALLSRRATIGLIAFNGGTAEAVFERHVRMSLTKRQQAIPRRRLPSTSPAHAALSVAEKQKRWLRALAEFL